MVCQNCHSHDVIKVQDQFFCVNCGNLVAPPQPKAKEPIPVVVPAIDGLPEGVTILPVGDMVTAVVAGKPVKRKRPGRPKATRLDQPVTSGGMRDISAGFAPVLSPDISEAKPASEAPEIAPVSVPQTVQASPSPASGPHGSRRLSDIAPARHAAPAPKVEQSTNKEHPPQPMVFGDLISSSLRGRFNPTHFCLALLPAILLAFVGGFIVLALAGDYTNVGRLVPQRLLLPVGGELLIIAALYYVSRSFMHGAIVYGAARRADHRPTTVARWMDMSARSFGARLRLDVLNGLAQLAVLALAGSLVVTGGILWPVPAWFQLGLLFVAFFALMYLLAGLMLSQGLGHVAVTLSTMNARQAFGLGWLFFRHHFELIGLKLLTFAVELLLLVPVAAAVAALIVLVPGNQTWLVVAGLVVGVTVAGASTGAASALWWQETYRRLVRADRLTEAVALLTGRKLASSTGSSANWIAALMLSLAVLAAVWPWLPLPTL